MDRRENRILIGQIDYTNVWPVFHHFRPESLSRKVSMVTEVPAVLNRRMLEGSLDVSPISSFAYGIGHEKFLLLPDLSVSARSAVNSILLFSREPLEHVINGRIALTNTSATSINLLKIIIEKAYGGKPTYWNSEPDLASMMRDSDAALLIGDHAIRASWEPHGYIVTDLGEVWKRWSGYGMTFAVWTVQRTFAERHGDFLAEILNAFTLSKQKSLHDLEPLIHRSVEEIGGSPVYWRHYFSNLCYDFLDEQRAGLALYFKYAYEMGLLETEVPLNMWSDNKLTRVKE
ncbi:menaquinone biosynthesis protein [Paenibacillus sp. YPG26]|uniref:menaquinone biosynthesis protein n=1 Tax=Paenibacillus sp. YPG26 TaxID=2878915 RepID=UPI00203BC95E|nr:menaquinone biosynthesis protein [Paenibacillus sp. YPG26]USB34766.1 menaquinone biosynthesis protein [Paenibacillus sp. YPG26]